MSIFRFTEEDILGHLPWDPGVYPAKVTAHRTELSKKKDSLNDVLTITVTSHEGKTKDMLVYFSEKGRGFSVPFWLAVYDCQPKDLIGKDIDFSATVGTDLMVELGKEVGPDGKRLFNRIVNWFTAGTVPF